MKTQILIIFMLVSSLSYAQISGGEYSKQLVDKFQEMAKSKISNPKKDDQICKAIPEFQRIQAKDLAPKLLDAFYMLSFYQKFTTQYTAKLNAQINGESFPTDEDKVLYELSNTTNYAEFVFNLTGKDIGQLKKDDQQNIRTLFDKHPLKLKKASTTVIESKLGNCSVKATVKMTPTKYSYPKVSWDLETAVRIDCPCEGKTSRDLKYAYFLITGNVDGTLATTTASFEKLRDAKVELRAVICCSPQVAYVGEGIVPDTYVEIPTHNIGVSGGVSLTNDFDETNYCVGLQYLYNATEIGNSNLLVGANLGYGGTNFMDWTSTRVTAGGTVQLFTPLTQSGQTQATNGVSANYINGCNDNMGVVVDFTGYSIVGNTGVNIQLSESFALFMELPIITHQTLTFKPENGGPEFETSETEVMVFKNNPIKVGARFGF